MVTSSMPMPMPQMKRQRLRLKASCWNAITSDAAAYQASEPMKITRRPSRSATKPNRAVPTNRPKKKAATKPAMPVVPNRPGVVVVRMSAAIAPAGPRSGRRQTTISAAFIFAVHVVGDHADIGRRHLQPVLALQGRQRVFMPVVPVLMHGIGAELVVAGVPLIGFLLIDQLQDGGLRKTGQLLAHGALFGRQVGIRHLDQRLIGTPL